jgi:hypothetical protein
VLDLVTPIVRNSSHHHLILSKQEAIGMLTSSQGIRAQPSRDQCALKLVVMGYAKRYKTQINLNLPIGRFAPSLAGSFHSTTLKAHSYLKLARSILTLAWFTFLELFSISYF